MSSSTIQFNPFTCNLDLVGAGGNSPSVLNVAVQSGTSPVSPTVAGLLTFNGATVAAGTHPVRTDGTGANTMALEVQISQAIAATDATKIGLSAFNSAEFTVDANGFVSLVGSGSAIESVNLDTGTTPIVPSSGAITLTGATVAAGTHPIRTNGTGANTGSIQVQFAQALASTDATKVGLANFDSADFTVDANGFVSASTTGFIKTITGSSGGAIPPTANNVNLLAATVAAGTTPLAVAGSGSTLTINAQKSQAISAADATKIGLSNFNSNQFSVDANGFVSIINDGFPWTDEAISFNAVSQNGYFITANATATLPASPSQGNTIEFFVDGAVTLTLQANTGQTIQFASNISSSAGTQVNTASGDSCKLVYRSADTKWCAVNFVGAWNFT